MVLSAAIFALLFARSAGSRGNGQPLCPSGAKLSVIVEGGEFKYESIEYRIQCDILFGNEKRTDTMQTRATSFKWNFYAESTFRTDEAAASVSSICYLGASGQYISKRFDQDFGSIDSTPYRISLWNTVGRLNYGPALRLRFTYAIDCLQAAGQVPVQMPAPAPVPVQTPAPAPVPAPINGGWACPSKCESLANMALTCTNPAPQHGGKYCPQTGMTSSPCGESAGCRFCRIPSTLREFSLDSVGRNYVYQNFHPGTLTCAADYIGIATYEMCRTNGDEAKFHGCEPICAQPRDTAGYDISTVVEQTRENPAFTLPTVTCADGYTGMAQVTACMKGGERYQLNGCTRAPTSKAPINGGTTHNQDTDRENIASTTHNQEMDRENSASTTHNQDTDRENIASTTHNQEMDRENSASPTQGRQGKDTNINNNKSSAQGNEEEGFPVGLLMGILIPIVMVLAISAFVLWHYHGTLPIWNAKTHRARTRSNDGRTSPNDGGTSSNDGGMLGDAASRNSLTVPAHSNLYSFAASILRMKTSARSGSEKSKSSKSRRSKPQNHRVCDNTAAKNKSDLESGVEGKRTESTRTRSQSNDRKSELHWVVGAGLE
eukprot:GEMP01036208.1.p1 GENE.GEMP01036208.1~~GEMP01036208.1.p1  ORF type:complete len:604 (-),score=79.68 GEMP01036208.1:102-1913(-)